MKAKPRRWYTRQFERCSHQFSNADTVQVIYQAETPFSIDDPISKITTERKGHVLKP
jgi:hypothetical protein